MTIITVPDGVVFPPTSMTPSGVPGLDNTLVLDAASEAAGISFQAPAAGSLTDIWFHTSDTFVSGATVNVELQATSGTTGNPPGTPVGAPIAAGASGTAAVAAANTGYTVPLSTPYTVTLGQNLSIVIANPSSSFGNFHIGAYQDETGEFPIGYLYTASWAKSTRIPGVSVKIGGVWYRIQLSWPMLSIGSVTFNSGSGPNNIGAYWRPKWPLSIKGIWAHMDFDGDFDIKLFSNNGSSVLGSYSHDSTIRRSSNGGMFEFLFTTVVTLSKDVFYRIVIVPTTVTNLTLYYYTFDSAITNAQPGCSGADLHYTEATNPAAEGDWSQTATRRPFMGFLINGFDDGTAVSSGGAVGSLIGGGLFS